MTEKLMKAIYSDPAQTITLTAWADTVAVDPRDNLLIAVRLGGYPEVTAGLVNAVSGGGTLSVQLDGETLVCTPQQGRYSKAVSRDGTYAVAALLWDNQSARKQGEKQQTEEMEGKEQKEKTDKAQEARVYYLACPVRDKTALYHEIDKVSTIPMLPEFRDYMINELQARDMLAPCRVYTTGEPFAIWRLTCTPDDQNIADVLTDGLKAGVIRIPSTWPCQPDAFTEINGVAGYLRAFGSVIASRIRGQFQPLYDPAQEPLSEGVLGLDQFVAQTAGYHLYGAQLAAAEALRRRLQTARFGLLIAECGSGKSKVGSLALQAYFLQKHRKCLHIVLCPSHMTGKWVRELEEAIPNARAAIVRTPADMDALYAGYARGGRTVFAVLSRESARDGYMRRPAARWDARRQGFTCPDCGSVIQMEFMDCGKRTLTDATPEYFRTETRANRKCEGCGAVLWTATTAEEQSEWVRISHLGYVHRRFAYLARDACKTAAAKKQLAALLREPDRFMAARGACRRFPLSTYIKNRYRGKIDGLIADELHQFSADSGQGDAMGELFAAAKKCIGMTATLINGYASGIFYLLYRMCACRMEQDGQSYAAPAQFAREYGVTEDTYEVTEGGYNSNRRTAKRKKRSRQKPGVSPLVYSRFLLENGVFLSLMDMGKDLPEYEEIPVPLQLPELEESFRELLRTRSGEGRRLAQKLLSVFLNFMMAYPDQPYGHKPVVHPDTGQALFAAEDSGLPEEQTEKDRRTLEIVCRKVSAGGRMLLYVNWVCLGSRTRLKRFLTDAGVRAEIMEDTVPPRKREEWVANHLRQGMQVMIVNPAKIEKGCASVRTPYFV